MKRILMALPMVLLLGACAQKSAYEAAVEDYEPVYCYKSLAGVQCYEKPNFRDERRMVNYFGPAPVRYDRPEPKEAPELFAPKPVSYWVKDPEPRARPAPQGDLADRPWFDGADVVSEAELDARRGRAPAQSGDAQAFLKRIEAALAAKTAPPQ